MGESDNIENFIEDSPETLCGLKSRLPSTIKIGDMVVTVDKCYDDSGMKCPYVRRYELTGDLLCTWRPELPKRLIRGYK